MLTEQYQNNQSFQSHQSLTALVDQPPSPLYAKDWVQQGSIARVADRDDVDIWKGWRRYVYMLVPFLTFGNTAIYVFYLVLRIACVILAQNAAHQTYAGAWVFIALEVATAIPSMMHNAWTMWALKGRQRPKLRLTGDDCPNVDVFITCCGEDDEVVIDTVHAAADQDYPIDKFRVIVLDDAKSSSLEASVRQLALTYPNVHYMARTKIPGVPHHFKAGNLNYGLEQTRLMPGGAGQFMAALDADMVTPLSTVISKTPLADCEDPRTTMAPRDSPSLADRPKDGACLSPPAFLQLSPCRSLGTELGLFRTCH